MSTERSARSSERPELARLVTGTDAVLSRLVERYRVVAAISGRTQDELEAPRRRRRGSVDRLVWTRARVGSRRSDRRVLAAADEVEGAWMETKGATIAVHYRATPDAARRAGSCEQRLGALAVPARMALVSGKYVVELVPAGLPLKEGAVERIIESEQLHAALYAGDDLADLLGVRGARSRSCGRTARTRREGRGPRSRNARGAGGGGGHRRRGCLRRWSSSWRRSSRSVGGGPDRVERLQLRREPLWRRVRLYGPSTGRARVASALPRASPVRRGSRRPSRGCRTGSP